MNTAQQHELFEIAKRVARRHATEDTPANDLVAVAFLAGRDIAARFDPTRDAKLKTYVWQRMRGAVLDYLTDQRSPVSGERDAVKRGTHQPSIAVPLVLEINDDAEPKEQALYRETHTAVETPRDVEGLNNLTDDQREALNIVYRGDPNESGRSLKTMRRRAALAITKLQRHNADNLHHRTTKRSKRRPPKPRATPLHLSSGLFARPIIDRPDYCHGAIKTIVPNATKRTTSKYGANKNGLEHLPKNSTA